MSPPIAETLQWDRRRLLDHFTLDRRRAQGGRGGQNRLRGHGSCSLEAGREGEVLLLQAKQAEASALAGYVDEFGLHQSGGASGRRPASDAGLE